MPTRKELLERIRVETMLGHRGRAAQLQDQLDQMPPDDKPAARSVKPLTPEQEWIARRLKMDQEAASSVFQPKPALTAEELSAMKDDLAARLKIDRSVFDRPAKETSQDD